MVLNATFNNISAISWQSVLLVEENGVSEEIPGSIASRLSFYLRLLITALVFSNSSFNFELKSYFGYMFC
jgi:hypothetical protein